MTLIETLLAVSMLALVVTATASVLFVGQGSSQAGVEAIDTTQQLRVAVKQMADDLAYATWDVRPECGSRADGYSFDGCQLRVRVYQPVADANSAPYPGWPGNLTSTVALTIRYTLDGDSLIREVYQVGDETRLYSQRAVVTGLIPYDGTADGSSLTSPGSKMVAISLRMNRVHSGGGRRAVQASSIFYVR